MSDNKSYSDLMNEYKLIRNDPKRFDEANKLLDQALALRKSGKVSVKEVIAAQYL